MISGLEPEGVDSLVPMCDLFEDGVSLNVMSKAYGLAGLRIGWIVTQNKDVLLRMAAYKDYVSIWYQLCLVLFFLRQTQKKTKKPKQKPTNNLETSPKLSQFICPIRILGHRGTPAERDHLVQEQSHHRQKS